MGPELIKNGSFEFLQASFIADKTNIPVKGVVPDPGTMTLVDGSNEVRDWFVSYGPICLMTDQNLRANPYHIGPWGPDAGKYFLDLTGNGLRPGGGISQFIDITPGRYQISLAVGMADVAGPLSGPVEINVGLFSLLSKVRIGTAIFHLDRGEVPYAANGQWKVFTQDIVVDDDPFEKIDEEIAETLARIVHQHRPPVPHSTVLQIVADVIQSERDKYNLPPSKFVGLDSVSVKQIGPPPVGVRGLRTPH
jgi:hypothetical protein